MRDTLLAAGALVLLVPSSDARLRFQSHRFDHICRVVVVADSPRGRRILYDGPVGIDADLLPGAATLRVELVSERFESVTRDLPVRIVNPE